MSELNKKYEELIEKDAKAVKEDALMELKQYKDDTRGKMAGGNGGEEPKAIAGPYSYTLSELIGHVEDETPIGRGLINGISSLKATLQGRR
jgi:hypothetical protein